MSQDASTPDSRTQLDEAMRSFMARVVLFQDAVARSVGLNSTDLQTVGLLMSEGPASPGDLAERIGITQGGAVTSLIDRLEKAGYVTRRRDEQDRRRVLVVADEQKVIADVGHIYGRVADRWNTYLSTLTDDEIAVGARILAAAAEVNREEIERLRRER
ncbi:MarR family transcriptional regulator [Actinoplanes bogorensis]|uniref:MarR family transcriptional regulator n=1 Tax=Paractinoplanes bogorensis TaxID=1610840 RepID=A0ABS5YU87_9ACTN|nr:MarR family transcriptional regulator [Actinoplanes bogorensis]MBU2667012.1 MarR family transcriptional regulator [Actinoplanes bogorensis]